MAIYLKYGSKVKGNVTTEQYKDWIELHSFQWGVGRGITPGHGVGANRQGSHASVSECTITKVLDVSTLGSLTDIFKGKLDTEAEIHFTQTDADNFAYLKIKMSDTGLSGYSISSGGDRPSESLSLNFSKIAITDVKTSDDGTTKTPETITYDLTKMVMV